MRSGRKERIIDTLSNMCVAPNPQGATASEISDVTGIARSNVSRILNDLSRAGVAVKRGGKPVRFVPAGMARSQAGKDNVEEIAGNPLPGDALFNEMVGAEGSLKTQVNQAKAAVLYPGGLHTLILGPSGTGKNLLAEIMYKFAVASRVLPEDSPMVHFNCAEYANNPDLLMGHLFGHVKGAFTGADRDRPGIVEQADGGFLFLDEIHRLPPEGQEMLFTLLDEGHYQRLGDSERRNKASIRLIGATTEGPDRALLKTFLRRIPLTISIPPLEERSRAERVELVRLFFKAESRRIKLRIRVSFRVMRSLLTYSPAGNVGQLKSDIQIACARAFLRYLPGGGPDMSVSLEDLPEHVRQEADLVYANVDSHGKGATNTDFVVEPAGDHVSQEQLDSYLLPEDFYVRTRKHLEELLDGGTPREEASKIMALDLDLYFGEIMAHFASGKHVTGVELRRVVPAPLVDAVEKSLKAAGQILGRDFGVRALCGLTFHMNSVLERSRGASDVLSRSYIQKSDGSPEFRAAVLIKNSLERDLNTQIPAGEVAFISAFLKSTNPKTKPGRGEVSVLVMAHGVSTASSMAGVANKLLGIPSCCMAVDMPLDTEPKIAVNEAVWKIRNAHTSKGALVLVDMGSLTMLADELKTRTESPIEVVDNVTTAMVIEATRKSLVPNVTLREVKGSVDAWRAPDHYHRPLTRSVPTVITTCITGRGAAEKVKSLIVECLPPEQAGQCNIIPASAAAVANPESLAEILKGSSLIAVVGTIDPALPGVSFIPLDQILSGEGLARLAALLGFASSPTADRDAERRLSAGITMQSLLEHMVFMNPRKALESAETALEKIERSLKVHVEKSMRVRFLVHFSCLLERLITHNAVTAHPKVDTLFSTRSLETLESVCRESATQFGIEIPKAEICYIADILDLWS